MDYIADCNMILSPTYTAITYFEANASLRVLFDYNDIITKLIPNIHKKKFDTHIQ